MYNPEVTIIPKIVGIRDYHNPDYNPDFVEPYLKQKKSDELKNFMLKLDNANSIGSLFELSS